MQGNALHYAEGTCLRAQKNELGIKKHEKEVELTWTGDWGER